LRPPVAVGSLGREFLIPKANGGEGEMYIRTAIFLPKSEDQGQFIAYFLPQNPIFNILISVSS